MRMFSNRGRCDCHLNPRHVAQVSVLDTEFFVSYAANRVGLLIEASRL